MFLHARLRVSLSRLFFYLFIEVLLFILSSLPRTRSFSSVLYFGSECFRCAFSLLFPISCEEFQSSESIAALDNNVSITEVSN